MNSEIHSVYAELERAEQTVGELSWAKPFDQLSLSFGILRIVHGSEHFKAQPKDFTARSKDVAQVQNTNHKPLTPNPAPLTPNT